MSTISVTNTDSDLSGNTVVTAEGARAITGLLTFNRSPSAPFAVQAGSGSVANLDADKLDGLDSTYFLNLSNATAGTVPSARLGTGTANKTTVYRGDQTFQPFASSVCNGRLTLTSGVPVTPTDVTGATTIYFTPYGGAYIGLYDGSTGWDVLKFAETSLALGTLTSGLPYDVFGFNNSGTLNTELLAWTNGTTRATALVLQDGVYCKTGALTRRYLGTFYTTSTTATEDSATKRFVWNYYNRVPRTLFKTEATASWTYTTATWRQANAAAANKVEVIVGVAEPILDLHLLVAAVNTTGANVSAGIGEDSTSAVATAGALSVFNTFNTGQAWTTGAVVRKVPAVGYHFYAWLEISGAAGTTTWYSAQATFTGNQSGLAGSFAG